MLGRCRSTAWHVAAAAIVLLVAGPVAFPPEGWTVGEVTEPQLGLPHATGEGDTEREGGQYPLYIVKELVETTSGFTNVVWVQGPEVLATRHRVLQGAEAMNWYEVSGLTVRLAKEALDTTKVVIEVETLALMGDLTANLTIEKGAIGYTRSEIHAYDVARERFAELGVFLNDDPIDPVPYRFQPDLSPLYSVPAAIAQLRRSGEDLERKVFAFYYPWYGNPAGPSGYWEHWEESTPASPPTESLIAASAHYPLLGPYDAADEGVILAHMTIAKDAGIDGFISSWWGIDTFEDKQVSRILRVAETTGMNVTIYYETIRDRVLTQGLVVTELTHVLRTYASSPAFLRSAGKPVLFIYAAHQWSAGFWLGVRKALETAVGPVVLIGDVLEDAYLQAFDGFHTYSYLDSDIEAFYDEAKERLKRGLSAGQSLDDAFASAYAGDSVGVDVKAFALSASPGFDTSYWGPVGFKRNREGGALYRRYWEAAMAIDASMVLITSWNEWHEGTEIEPSREYGFDYIRLTRQLVQEYKQTTLALPETGYSANLLPFELHLDNTGEGSLLLAATDERPMILIRVELRGLEGVRDVDLRGEFHTYLKRKDGASVSVVVPSIPRGETLTLRATFVGGFWSSRINVSVHAYDPAGTFYPLFGGQVEPQGIAPTRFAVPTVVSVLAALGLVLYLRRSGRLKRK